MPETTAEIIAGIQKRTPRAYSPGMDPEILHRLARGALHAAHLVASEAEEAAHRINALEVAVLGLSEKLAGQAAKIATLEESLANARKAFKELKGKESKDAKASS